MRTENQTKKPSRVSLGGIILVLVYLIALLTGCTQSDEIADLHIRMERYQGSRTIDPDNPLSVVKYTVIGAGPDGTSFSVQTAESQITVTGLQTGTWEITAIGYSSNDVGLIQGQASIVLSNNNSSGEVVMEEFFGSGNAEITVVWDDSQTIDPVVASTIELCGSAGEAEVLEGVAAAGGGSITYTLTDRPAGAYLFCSTLTSNGSKVGGSAEIIRIIDSKTTTGTVPLVFNDLQVTLGLPITDTSAPPISGTISGLPKTITGEEPTIPVTFIPDEDSLQTDLTCQWFVDGAYVATGNPIQLNAPGGKHRLDVVVTAPNIGSTGSVAQDFHAIGTVTTGTPLLFAEYVHGEQTDMLLDGISDIAVLPDGLIITTASNSDSVQTLMHTSDTLTVKQTFTHDGSAHLLDGPSMIAASGDGTIIAVGSDNSNAIMIFNHSINSDTISRLQTILCSSNDPGATYAISDIGAIALNSDGTHLFVADGNADNNTITLFTRTEAGQAFSFEGNYAFTFGENKPAIVSIRSMAVDYDDTLLSLASYATNSLHILKIEPSGALSSSYAFSHSSCLWYGLSEIQQVLHPERNTLFTLASDTIAEYELIDAAFGVPEFTQTSRLKSGTHIPVAFNPKDCDSTSDVSRLFAVTSTGKGIVCFDNDLANFDLSYDSFVSTDALVPDSCAVSADDRYLLVSSSGGDCLQLYKFAL